MSIEIPEDRQVALDAAAGLIRDDELLKGDALTQEMLGNGFKVNGDDVDPGEWLNDRKAFLIEEAESAPMKAHLANVRAEDLEGQHSKRDEREDK